MEFSILNATIEIRSGVHKNSQKLRIDQNLNNSLLNVMANEIKSRVLKPFKSEMSGMAEDYRQRNIPLSSLEQPTLRPIHF